MRLRRVPGPAAAAVAALAASLLVPASPASAAACPGDTGVTVVVDFTGVGGGVATGCVADGGGDTAADLFEVEHDLTRVQSQPGAVCKVDGAPGSAGCTRMPPADAYWGLFWSDGSGGWTYSSEGVDSLNVPDGGSVGFAWQDGGDYDYPGQAPAQSESPQPTGDGSSGGGTGGSGGSGGSSTGAGRTGGAGNGPSSSGSPTAAEPTSGDGRGDDSGRDGGADGGRDRDGDGSRERDRDGAREPGEETSSDAAAAPSPAADATAAEPPLAASDGGLPVWVAPALVGALFLVAGGVALARRRSAG